MSVKRKRSFILHIFCQMFSVLKMNLIKSEEDEPDKMKQLLVSSSSCNTHNNDAGFNREISKF